MEHHGIPAKAPLTRWRACWLIFIDGLQQLDRKFQAAMHTISEILSWTYGLMSAYFLHKVIEAGLTYLDLQKHGPTMTRAELAGLFLLMFAIWMLFSFAVGMTLEFADAAAKKRWGAAYVRSLPAWTRSPFIAIMRDDLMLHSSRRAKWLFGLIRSLLSFPLRKRPPTQPTNKLACGVCGNLERTSGLHITHITIEYSNLGQSEKHCVVCRLLYIATRRLLLPPDPSGPFFNEWKHYRPQCNIILTWDYDSKRISFKMVPDAAPLKSKWTAKSPALFFYSMEGEQNIPLLGTPRSSSAIDPRSTESLHQIASWISKCTLEHDDCGRKQPKPLPDRILDLGNSPQSPVKLRDTSNELEYYACLSHRWGLVQPLRTLKQNRKSFEDHIPIDLLPNTFQDSITMCRMLSIRYLWIDSLCIVQDSVEDWQRQSAKMANIFEDSFLTIAATKATGHSDGLFPTRGTEIQSRVQSISPPEIGHGVSHLIFMCLDFNHYTFCGTDHWEPDSLSRAAKEWPLLSRAWVFQERLLSPRLLHCWQNGILWECKSFLLCDCDTAGRKKSDDASFRNLISHQSMSNVELTPWELRCRWYRIVERYSQVMINLTYESDVFPALSGLATRISGLLGDEYVAGLWGRNLIEGLLWKVNGFSVVSPGKVPGLRKHPHAPSWSWAAASCQVDYINKGDDVPEIYARVVDVKYTPGGVHSTGRISSAMLTLSGVVHNAQITDFGDIYFQDGSKGNFCCDFDRIYTDERGYSHNDLYDLDSNSLHGRGVLCLKLAKSGIYEWYLVLQKDSPGSPHFRRLGLLYRRHVKVNWRWKEYGTWHYRALRRYYEERTITIV